MAQSARSHPQTSSRLLICTGPETITAAVVVLAVVPLLLSSLVLDAAICEHAPGLASYRDWAVSNHVDYPCTRGWTGSVRKLGFVARHLPSPLFNLMLHPSNGFVTLPLLYAVHAAWMVWLSLTPVSQHVISHPVNRIWCHALRLAYTLSFSAGLLVIDKLPEAAAAYWVLHLVFKADISVLMRLCLKALIYKLPFWDHLLNTALDMGIRIVTYKWLQPYLTHLAIQAPSISIQPPITVFLYLLLSGICSTAACWSCTACWYPYCPDSSNSDPPDHKPPQSPIKALYSSCKPAVKAMMSFIPSRMTDRPDGVLVQIDEPTTGHVHAEHRTDAMQEAQPAAKRSRSGVFSPTAQVFSWFHAHNHNTIKINGCVDAILSNQPNFQKALYRRKGKQMLISVKVAHPEKQDYDDAAEQVRQLAESALQSSWTQTGGRLHDMPASLPFTMPGCVQLVISIEAAADIPNARLQQWVQRFMQHFGHRVQQFDKGALAVIGSDTENDFHPMTMALIEPAVPFGHPSLLTQAPASPSGHTLAPSTLGLSAPSNLAEKPAVITVYINGISTPGSDHPAYRHAFSADGATPAATATYTHPLPSARVVIKQRGVSLHDAVVQAQLPAGPLKLEVSGLQEGAAMLMVFDAETANAATQKAIPRPTSASLQAHDPATLVPPTSTTPGDQNSAQLNPVPMDPAIPAFSSPVSAHGVPPTPVGPSTAPEPPVPSDPSAPVHTAPPTPVSRPPRVLLAAPFLVAPHSMAAELNQLFEVMVQQQAEEDGEAGQQHGALQPAGTNMLQPADADVLQPAVIRGNRTATGIDEVADAAAANDATSDTALANGQPSIATARGILHPATATHALEPTTIAPQTRATAPGSGASANPVQSAEVFEGVQQEGQLRARVWTHHMSPLCGDIAALMAQCYSLTGNADPAATASLQRMAAPIISYLQQQGMRETLQHVLRQMQVAGVSMSQHLAYQAAISAFGRKLRATATLSATWIITRIKSISVYIILTIAEAASSVGTLIHTGLSGITVVLSASMHVIIAAVHSTSDGLGSLSKHITPAIRASLTGFPNPLTERQFMQYHASAIRTLDCHHRFVGPIGMIVLALRGHPYRSMLYAIILTDVVCSCLISLLPPNRQYYRERFRSAAVWAFSACFTLVWMGVLSYPTIWKGSYAIKFLMLGVYVPLLWQIRTPRLLSLSGLTHVVSYFLMSSSLWGIKTAAWRVGLTETCALISTFMAGAWARYMFMCDRDKRPRVIAPQQIPETAVCGGVKS